MDFGIFIIPSEESVWFYSTLAQVGAAIVGLIGAVLGALLIHRYSQALEKKKKINARLVYIKQRFRGHITCWGCMKEQMHKVIEYYSSTGNFPSKLNSYCSWGSTGGGKIGWKEISELKNDLDLLPSILSAIDYRNRAIKPAVLRAWSDELEALSVKAQGERGQKLVSSCSGEIDQIGRDIAYFQGSVIPVKFWGALVVLAWIGLTSIIWPPFDDGGVGQLEHRAGYESLLRTWLCRPSRCVSVSVA